MNDAYVPIWDVVFVQQAIRSLCVIIYEVSVIVGQKSETYSGGGHAFDSFDAARFEDYRRVDSGGFKDFLRDLIHSLAFGTFNERSFSQKFDVDVRQGGSVFFVEEFLKMAPFLHHEKDLPFKKRFIGESMNGGSRKGENCRVEFAR